MSNLKLLTKINIFSLIGYNKLKNPDKKEKKKVIIMSVLLVLSILILDVYGFALCLYLSDFLKEANQMELLLVMGIIGATSTTIFTSLQKVPSYLFQSKDYEMLASLPIKQSTILISKIVMIMLNNYILLSPLVLIPSIVYFIKTNTSFLYIPFLLILTLATPIIPILLSILIGFFIFNVSSKSKNSNLFSIILNLLMVVTLLLVSFNLPNIIMSLTNNSLSIIEISKKIYPLAYYFVDTLKNNNIMSLIIFVLISVVPMVLFVLILSNKYYKISSKLSETHKVNTYQFKELKTSKSIISLLKKEFKRYLSSTIYVLNSSMGMILLLMLSVAIMFLGFDKIATFLEIDMVMDIMKIEIIKIIAFCIVMTNTSSVSLSLEGENLWILKSLPVNETEIFKSKILFNMLLTIPISIISFLMIAIKLKLTLQSTIIALVSIILLSTFSSMLGLFINLVYPKFDFKNDTQVVKQSASVIISMIANILYLGMILLIKFIFKINNFDMFLIVSNIMILISIVILFKILKIKGKSIYENL